MSGSPRLTLRVRARPYVASVWLLAVSTIGCAQQIRTVDRIDVDKAAPDFAAKSLDGASVQLSSLRGKVVILHIWAAWNCAEELPGLDEIASRLPPGDVAVVAVSIDSERSDLTTVVQSR